MKPNKYLLLILALLLSAMFVGQGCVTGTYTLGRLEKKDPNRTSGGFDEINRTAMFCIIGDILIVNERTYDNEDSIGKNAAEAIGGGILFCVADLSFAKLIDWILPKKSSKKKKTNEKD